MGVWFSRPTAWIYRKVGVSEKGTQTPVRFTDKLTDYGTIEVSSTETFEHVCDTCANQEHEAVGFCKQCEQFYCFRCCKIHENIPALRNHIIVAKRDFMGVLDKREKMFGRQIVPVSVEPIPVVLDDGVPYDKEYSVQSIALSIATNTMFLLERQWYGTYLKVFNSDGSNTTVELSNAFHMIVCLPETNNGHCEFVLTLPDARQVRKGSISKNGFKSVMCFKTCGECWGIAEFDDGFAVTVNLKTGYSLPDWQVQYLDVKGNIKKQIYYDKDNKPLFSRPKYLVSNSTHDTLYVGDTFNNRAVIALDIYGNVLFTFLHNDLASPFGLTVDDEDNVYVAGYTSLIQIHKSGTKHRVLMTQNKKNGPVILSVCFNTVSRTLIVGDDSPMISTFNLLP